MNNLNAQPPHEVILRVALHGRRRSPHAVILHGPLGADLTRFSRAVADAYDCDHIIDGYVPLHSPLVPRALHLTNYTPDPAIFAPDVLILLIDPALSETPNWQGIN